MRLAFVVTWTIVAVVMAGCAPKRISDIDAGGTPSPISSGPAWSVPNGVFVNETDRGSLDIDGLYPSTVPDDKRCCWLAPSAVVGAIEPKGATTMTLTLLVPDYPFFEQHPQSVTATLAGQKTRIAGLAPGVHRIDIVLPGGERIAGPMQFELHSDRSFVPAHENVNADTRALGIILLGIAFKI